MPPPTLEAAAKAGSCGLLTVELDRRAGDEPPRVTIKRFQPLERLAKASRLQLDVRLADAAPLTRVAGELAAARGGTGVVRCVVPIAGGGEAILLVGRDFASMPNSPPGSSGSPAKAASTFRSRSRRNWPWSARYCVGRCARRRRAAAPPPAAGPPAAHVAGGLGFVHPRSLNRR